MMNIKFPSIVENISDDFYHSFDCPGLSKSDLDLVSLSPAHYYAKKEIKEDSEAFSFGRAFHSIVLTPSDFSNNYAVWSGKSRGTKEGKAEYQKACEENEGKTLITQKDVDTLHRMIDSLYSSLTASSLLTNGIAESAAFSIDPDTGLERKCKRDYCRNDGILVDLKSADSADIKSFSYAVTKYFYDKQAAYYLDVSSDVENKKYEDFIFIVVEKSAPYGVAIYSMDSEDIEIGRELYKRDLSKFLEYKNKVRKGYPDRIQKITRSKFNYDINNR